MERLQASKILVTGAAGFIGSHICEEAVKQGVYVIGIDDMSNGDMDNLRSLFENPLFEFQQGDVTSDLDGVKAHDNIQVIFHEAASKCTVCRTTPMRDCLVNAYGTLKIGQLARDMQARLIHASTGSVNHNNPQNFYGVSKMAGEKYLQVLSNEGLEYTGLRYYHVFGPRQQWHDLGGVIPIFIRNVFFDQPIKIFGDGFQVRYLTYVKDVVDANFRLANLPAFNGCMDVASDCGIGIFELSQLIAYMMDKLRHPIRFSPKRMGDISDFNIDTSIIRSTGWEIPRPFEYNLKHTIDWYVEQFRRLR